MLLMTALQFGHPVAVFVHVKTNDLLQNPGGWGFDGLHRSIVRGFVWEYVNFW